MRKILLLASVCAFISNVSAGQGPIKIDDYESVEMVSVGSSIWSDTYETTIYKPTGNGPFPVVIISHGKSYGDPRSTGRARFQIPATEFLRMGYVVFIPMRSGYSKSSGTYSESNCNSKYDISQQAEVLKDFLSAIKGRPYVDPNNILIVGQSYGGFIAVAMSDFSNIGVKGIVNFSGGFRYEGYGRNICDWRQSMIRAFHAFGEGAQIPSIWFYGDNDSFWGSELPKELFRAYGRPELSEFVSIGNYPYGDSHSFFLESNGLKLWLNKVSGFMERVGLRTH